MGKPLRIFFFSDWRIQSLERAEELIQSVAPVDVIVYGGDDVIRFASSSQNWFSTFARYTRYGVLAILGNDCDPIHRAILHVPGARDLHTHPIAIEGVGFLGIEGAICSESRNCRGSVVHTEKEVIKHLEVSLRRLGIYKQFIGKIVHLTRRLCAKFTFTSHLMTEVERLVVVSHTPPAGCRLDMSTRFGFSRLGSQALTDFVLEYQPVLVLCGHCHSCGGKSALLGNTLVINAASDDTNSRRAYAALIELTTPPTLTWLAPSDTLAGPDIGPKRAAILVSHGITHVEQILEAPSSLRAEIQFGPIRMARLEAYVRARAENTLVWLKSLDLPERLLFYDVETGLTSGGMFGLPQDPWMIAVFDGRVVRQWTIPEEDSERRRTMYRELLEYICLYPNHTLCSWSGTHFDERAIISGMMRWDRESLPIWDSFPKLDLLPLLKGSLVLPIANWALKDVATWCGFRYTSNLDGLEVGFYYEEYRAFGEPLPIEEISRYNAEDVQALAKVVERVRDALTKASSLSDSERM